MGFNTAWHAAFAPRKTSDRTKQRCTHGCQASTPLLVREVQYPGQAVAIKPREWIIQDVSDWPELSNAQTSKVVKRLVPACVQATGPAGSLPCGGQHRLE